MWDFATRACVLFFFLCLLFLHLIAGSQVEPVKAPGVAWKISYSDVPELEALQKAFAHFCKALPVYPAAYLKELMFNEKYQRIRQDCLRLPDEAFYTDMELGQRGDPDLAFMYDAKRFPIQVEGEIDPQFKPRLGCLSRNVPRTLEDYARQQIEALMHRLGLTNKLERLSDSRGFSYMNPWGCMEYHTNRNHMIGWRLYLHHLPKGEGSFFAYRHPYDGSYRRIPDSNLACNMFRLRDGKKGSPLLWHAIYSNTHRFSWGIYIPPELARHLKTKGTCV